MAAIMLVSLCAVGASTLGVSATQGSSSTPPVVGAPVGSGAPGVCSNNSTNLYLFIRGADNAIYLKISPDGTTWPSTETLLGGIVTSPPAATSPTSSVIDVFVRGTDGALWQTYYQNGCSTWIPLGGQFASGTGPAVALWSAGRLDVFVQSTDPQLWHVGVGWSGWSTLGGAPPEALSTPSPAATRIVTMDHTLVCVSSTSGNIWWSAV